MPVDEHCSTMTWEEFFGAVPKDDEVHEGLQLWTGSVRQFEELFERTFAKLSVSQAFLKKQRAASGESE